MAEPNIPVRHTSFRALQCPLRFHKAPQASGGNSEKVGNQGRSLLRRHADHGELQGGSSNPPSNSNASLDSSGVYPQPRQECSNTHSEGDFLGVLPGFTYHADLLANSQDPVRTTPDQRDLSPRTGNHSQAIPTPGLNGIHSSSSSGSPTALPPLGESQDYSTKTQSQLQHSGDNLRQHEAGFNLVVPRTPQTQWQVNANSAVGHGDRIRCINAGLGSESQQHQHRRTMGTTREVIPHQLPRVTGSIFGPQDLCHQHIQQGNSPEIRQCDSHCLPQQNGGDPFRDTLQSGSAHLGMVLGEEYIHPCRTPTREAECQSRLALTTHTGLQRLAATPSDLPTTSGQAGPFLNRPVCVTHKYSAFNLLQLETGSISNSNRCPVNLMERSSSLSVPTILTSRSLSGEDQPGEGGGCSNSTSVVQPGMVPFTAPESTGCTNLAPQHDGHNTESSGRAAPTCSGGTSSTSRMACIRESYGAKGLSDRVVSIMQMSWRTSTESAYSSVWRRWSSWCAQRQADPVSAPLNVILDYLTELYQEGKQYRTINTARSAISMTHDLVDGWRVGQHPITIQFLRGIFNSRPPAPRYTTTWDVDRVLIYIHNLPENGQLSLAVLAHKLAMLMALSNADRCSELASLDLRFRSYLREGVKFVIPGLTKTRRSGPPKEALYPSYPEDEKLCSVRTLESYELRTKQLHLQSTERSRLFLSVRKPHTPVKASTIGHWLQSLMAQAGIDVSMFSAHSTRGAATSKAKRMGVSTTDILKTADWSSVSTFRRFYHRPINCNEFGRKVLECPQR